MKARMRPISGLTGIALALTILACGGGSSPTEPNTSPMTAMGSANFTVSGTGGSQTNNYSNGINTVFCTRNAGWASLFIRFAEQTTANGSNGPHIDIDLCNHGGGGTFTPKDPNEASCGADKTWDVFWHAADGSVFANQVGAAGCTLQLTSMGSQLSGSFSCNNLVGLSGSGSVDVNGSFDCEEN